jgi:uncharacterized protein YcfL
MKPQLFLTLAAAAWLAACSTTSVNTVENADTTGQRKMVADKRIYTDSSLRGNIEIVGLNEATVGDLLKIQLEVLNRTKKLKTFSYRVEWYDANGMQVNTPATTAIAKQIEGGESINISAVSPHPNARDFRIKMMESVD